MPVSAISASTSTTADSAAAIVERALAPGALVPAFQPIVAIDSHSVVAYEALARWPEVVDATPGSVFAAAAECGRTAEVDWACRTAALRHAIGAGGIRERALFVNVEPVSVGRPVPDDLRAVIAASDGQAQVVLELTERALFRHPAALMATVSEARARGWGVALDDIGADPASLAMLPFVRPDVIKLDLSLIHGVPDAEQARIITAVMAHAERTGARILAEGIESDEHLARAVSLGATLGQGWLFGRPGPLPSGSSPARERIVIRPAATDDTPVSPFDLVRNHPNLRTGRKSLLLALSRHIEDQSQNLGAPPVVIGAFQTADRFTPATQRRYRRIARTCPFVGALGDGLSRSDIPGVRGGHLEPDDPLRDEWTVVVIGDHYAGALIAVDLHDDVDDADRRFNFVVTHNRDVVVAAAKSLMNRLLPAEDGAKGY